MTKLMERLIGRLKRLPETQQDRYAAAYLAELDDDQRWEELFAQTTDEEWQKIASKARTEARKEESVSLEEFLGSNES
ncbi:hypothetical protein [Salinibacter ruber]|jgi:L-rhamnose mutarotase|uniref:L-rhamnose mutarotase n=1 Tax=Salinibacter ruber TaxID=146919 RepID=A0A9X2TIB8_9BACT|nr:hypothetical protein [Salinibacter ruber]MCS3637483.1 L-rhamnose mutarotase [Salinibacter ruber]MCS3658824.1 L-rhamnose mutarotase [Salinibacter ruber]MCS3701190.1 L-rhamnose mutarotase [Salinibacter ruber]MCS3708628.1 L-rhamnose mutarotase [Salinibacter ruber]MCS4146770.1 L-rhamnose mutarotase [Salinibacter ruber]